MRLRKRIVHYQGKLDFQIKNTLINIRKFIEKKTIFKMRDNFIIYLGLIFNK